MYLPPDYTLKLLKSQWFLETEFVTVHRAGKTGQKQTSSLLARLFLSGFPHRADIRCFLSGIAGQEDAPCER